MRRATDKLDEHGRYDLAIDDELERAASHPSLATALASKVSRERIGNELEKMMESKNPARAFGHLCRWGLRPVVFKLPSELAICSEGVEGVDGPAVTELMLRRMTEAGRLPVSRPESRADSPAVSSMELAAPNRRVLLWGSFLSPLNEYGGGQICPVSHVLSQLRLPTPTISLVRRISEAAQEFLQFSREWFGALSQSQAIPKQPDKLKVGLTLCRVNDAWTLACALTSIILKDEDDAASFDRFKQWLTSDSKLLNCWTWKPPLSPQQLVKELRISGPQIGFCMKLQTEWMLANPDSTKDVDALTSHLREGLVGYKILTTRRVPLPKNSS